MNLKDIETKTKKDNSSVKRKQKNDNGLLGVKVDIYEYEINHFRSINTYDFRATFKSNLLFKSGYYFSYVLNPLIVLNH